MALRYNTATRNALADAFGDLFGGGTMEIRTGSQPSNGQDAVQGDLLGTITLPAEPFGAASNGAIAKAGTWSTTATDSGTAGWARIISDDESTSFDINISESGGGGEAIINDEEIVENGNIVINTFSYTVPSGS